MLKVSFALWIMLINQFTKLSPLGFLVKSVLLKPGCSYSSDFFSSPNMSDLGVFEEFLLLSVWHLLCCFNFWRAWFFDYS